MRRFVRRSGQATWQLGGLLALLLMAPAALGAPLSFHLIDSDPKRPSGVVLSAAGSHLVRDSTGRLVATYTLATQQATQYYNFAKTSTDDGATWSAAVRTESNPDSSTSGASVVDAQDILHLGFTFNVGSFATRSSDHGATWADAKALLDGGWGAWDYSPALAVSTNGNVHAVFYAAFAWSDPPYNIKHAISTDGGATYGAATAITDVPNDDAAYSTGAILPALTAGPDNQLFLLYQLQKSATDAKIVLRRWDGSTWGAAVDVSSSSAVSTGASDVAVDSKGTVHLVWVETPSGKSAAVVGYRTYDPKTQTLSTPRVLSAQGEAASEVSLGVYASDAILVAYSLYDATAQKYGGVKLVRSDDDFATAEVISTHAEARSPSLRYQYGSFHNPDKKDIAWIEVNDVSGGEMLVHGMVGGGTVTPKGFRISAYGPRIVNPGQDATFLIQYENGRAEDLTDVVVSASLPVGFPYVRSTHGGQVRATASAEEAYFRLGTVAAKARGFLGLTLRVPWAVPQGQAGIALRAGASGNVGRIAPADYPETPPGAVVGTEVLDEAAAKAWVAGNEKVARVASAVTGMGYLGPYGAQRVQLGNGKEVIRAFLLHPTSGMAGIVTSQGTQPYAELFARGERTVLDASGGYRVSKLEGSLEPFGSWAVTHSPSVARCQINCTLSKVPGWVAESASKTVGAISTGIDCVTCARSKGKDAGACAKCANAYHDVPGVGQTVDVAECLKDCLENPSKHVCTEDKRECSTSWGATFASWAGKQTVAVTYCNKVTGTYDPISRDLYCDRGEVCVSGACMSKEDMCGTSYRSSGARGHAIAYAGYDDATCSLTPFEVVPAHDPNALSVVPGGDVVAGEELSYTVEYQNTGAGEAKGVFVIDTVSDKLDPASVVPSDGGTFSTASGLATWPIGDLAPDAGGSVILKAKVPAGAAAGTEIFGQAEVHFPSAGEVTPTNPVYNVVREVAARPQRVEVAAGSTQEVTLSGAAVGAGELSFVITRMPVFGSLSGTPPKISYVAQEGFVGQDAFEFVAVQNQTRSRPALVTVNVVAVKSDTTAPTVVETRPASGATGVRVGGAGSDRPILAAVLSEVIDPSSVHGDSFTVSGVSGQVAWDAVSRTLSFHPLVDGGAAAFAPGKTYEAVVGGDVADYAGNKLARTTFSFTTAASKALRAVLSPGQSTLELTAATGVDTERGIVTALSAGIEAVKVSKVALSGKNAADFKVAEESCVKDALVPGATCFVAITAKGAAVGTLEATLTLESDVAAGALSVPLLARIGAATDGGADAATEGGVEAGAEGGSSDARTEAGGGEGTTTTTCSCRTAGQADGGAGGKKAGRLAWASLLLAGLMGLRRRKARG